MRYLAMLLAALIASCGGGGPPGPGTSVGTSTAANAVTMIVDGGPAGIPFNNIDAGFVSVTVCAPGTNNCQTIDHIMVDTNSTGLRLAQGVLSAGVANALTPQRDVSASPLAECLRFADGSLFWGWLRLADLKMSAEQALSTTIQLLGDPTLPALPAGCAGTLQSTVADIGANGVLGVGNFIHDCGSFCATNSANGQYYRCPAGSGCNSTSVPLAQQIVHPVSRFAQDNNGVLIQLPAVLPTGAPSAAGLLVFGIGTQANNALGSARVLTVDPVFGLFTIFNGSTTYTNGSLDSGSNVFWLPSSINNQLCPASDPTAAGFLCPSPAFALTLTAAGQNGTMASAPISVVDPRPLFSSGMLTAFNNIAAPNPDPNGLTLGLPFFFGRNIFTAIEGAATPAGSGPYVAF